MSRIDNKKSVKLDKLVILSFLILLISVSFLINFLKTLKYLSEKSLIKQNSVAVFRTNKRGNGAILGKRLYDFYPRLKTFVMPPQKEDTKINTFYKKYRFYPHILDLYSYPIAVKYQDYNCFLKKGEFELLKNMSFFSEKVYRLQYYLIKIKTSGDKTVMALFVYEDNVVVAPMNWSSTKIK